MGVHFLKKKGYTTFVSGNIKINKEVFIINTKMLEQFDVMTEAELSTVEGGWGYV